MMFFGCGNAKLFKKKVDWPWIWCLKKKKRISQVFSSAMMKIWWWQCHDNSHNSQGHLSQCETPTLHPANWCLFFFFRGRAVKLMYCCPGSSKEAKTLLGHPSVPAFWYLDSFPDSFTSRAQSSLIRWYLQAVVTSLKVLWPASLFNIAQKKTAPSKNFGSKSLVIHSLATAGGGPQRNKAVEKRWSERIILE